MRTLPSGLSAQLARRGRPLDRMHLFDITLSDGTKHYWASHAVTFADATPGNLQTYKPWVREPPVFKLTRSLQSDYGEFRIQNLSGNTIDREVAALIRAGEFQGAYCIYRCVFFWGNAASNEVGFDFHGFIREQEIGPEDVRFRVSQLFQAAEIPAYDFLQTRDCHFRYRSAQCGMRRGTLLVSLQTANIWSANTIGRSSLSLVPDIYRDEMVMILAGTGAGQERYIASHTATTFTLKTAWTTTPDGTSQFIVTGPGTMKVSPQLADIFSSTTIGKTGLGRTADEDKDELVMIISGTGAGQERRIATNTATTYTVSPAWTTTPDATSRFIVVYRLCPKDRAACNTRGVLERFPGIIHMPATVSNLIQPAPNPYAPFGFQPDGSWREPPFWRDPAAGTWRE